VDILLAVKQDLPDMEERNMIVVEIVVFGVQKLVLVLAIASNSNLSKKAKTVLQALRLIMEVIVVVDIVK
jgi:hypothetical protein